MWPEKSGKADPLESEFWVVWVSSFCGNPKPYTLNPKSYSSWFQTCDRVFQGFNKCFVGSYQCLSLGGFLYLGSFRKASVQGLGLKFLGLRLGVWDSGCRVCRVLGFRDLGFRNLGFRDLGFRG